MGKETMSGKILGWSHFPVQADSMCITSLHTVCTHGHGPQGKLIYVTLDQVID